MKEREYTPSVLDFAHDIIAMNDEIVMLKRELEHYKELDKINSKSIDDSRNNTNESIGFILSAVLDPESAINKGNEAIIREQLREKS